MVREQQTLSVLFADILGSERLQERIGRAETSHAVERCLKRMHRVIESCHGRLAKRVDNEVLALFDSAEATALAGIEIQKRIDALPPVSGVKLALRVGLKQDEGRAEGDELFGASVDGAVSLARLATAGQILVDQQTRALFSPSLQACTLALRQSDSLSSTQQGGLRLFEIPWRKSDVPNEHKTASVSGNLMRSGVGRDRPKLLLRYADKIIAMEPEQEVFNIGRQLDCHLIVRDQRASRAHARIERRGAELVLIDASANGTFVTLGAEAERLLRHEEMRLYGKGLICFAVSAASQDADIAQFECL
ncbi:MAG: adenylate/guanylate cyclase domain-containing protein [Pseudomonadota bacterium]